MSIARSFLGPLLSGALTSATRRDLRRRIAELRRRLSGGRHVVHYFHQTDDPYSHLAAQVLARLLATWDLEIVPHLVGPPGDEAAPERARLVSYSRKDAADVAPDYRLSFADPGRQPNPDLLRLAERILAGAIDSGRFTDTVVHAGAALWSGSGPDLEALAHENPPADEKTTRASRDGGDTLRGSLGHYLGATFYYAGEWYWGVDRLHHLEARLEEIGARRAGVASPPPLRAPSEGSVSRGTGEQRLRLEFFVSLRSPYSYIAMPPTFALAERHPIELVLRPVLPMVMRGLPVPLPKRLYILVDTKREADALGIPFGRVADPVGRPIERGFSLYPFARDRGKGAEYLHSFAKAAFADGIDTGGEAGLRRVVERIGLSWYDARPHLDAEGWREELERNREEMLAMGLWGVPSYRLSGPGDEPSFCTWGQDRLWLVEQHIRRRLGG